MRIALLSDVHGNLSGLEAVLASIATQSPDLTLFAGDLCVNGARPAACLQLLRAERIPAVHGNTDLWITGGLQTPEHMQANAEWTAAQLSAEERDWLARQPFSLTINPTSEPATALHVVHANPRDVNQFFLPPEADQPRYTSERQSDAEAAALLGDLPAAVLAFGHLHIPSVRRVRGCSLLNVSSVSLPGDGDPRAKYALATWDGRQWLTDHVRVAYNVAAEIDAYRVARPPGWEDAITSLQAEV